MLTLVPFTTIVIRITNPNYFSNTKHITFLSLLQVQEVMDQKVTMGSGASEDDHSKLKNTTLNNNNKNKNKNLFYHDEKVKSWEYSYGFPWPPRSHYRCSFCRREFKSAQALGGHMNVHRRERAKFRSNPSSSSPPNYEIAPPNPNPNLYNPSDLTLSIPPSPSSLATTSIYTHQYSLVSLSLSCLSPLSSSNFKGGFCFKGEDEKDRGVKLDLELGPISDIKEDDQDLDLELRLGTLRKT